MTPHAPDPAATEALLAFWRDAGIDSCYLDEPLDRTIFVAPTPPPAVLRAVPQVAPAGGTLPVEQAVAEARRIAATAQTLEELEQAISQFKACPLTGLGAKQAVFGRGNPKADLLVIGEGPGEVEDQSGIAFSGEPGRLLERILAAGGLTDQSFLTNSVFWRPPGNRLPTAQELAICAPLVERIAALIQPKAVLFIGETAAKSFVKSDDSLMKLRGQWRDWTLQEGGLTLPSLTTFHPVFLLKTPMAKRAVWADVLQLMTKL
jgi:uracil-DNA glycosylase family 4